MLMAMDMNATEHATTSLVTAKRAQCQEAREADYTSHDHQAIRKHDCDECHELRAIGHHLEVLIQNIREQTGTDQTTLLRQTHDDTLYALYRAIAAANLRTSQNTQKGD